MRVTFVAIGLVESTTISSYDQGAEFSKCISIVDFETKNIGDDITLTARDVNDCCAAGSVPGAFLFDDYQGAQIVCGVGEGQKYYKAQSSTGKCQYGTCYVYKQNLPCEDGTKQRINGCCAAHSVGSFANFPDTCLGYEKTFSNTHSESVEYCTTYHQKYSPIGRMGTTHDGDDVKYALQWLGTTPSAANTPLKVCQGDCDDDSDCPGSSTCIDRTDHSPDVAGCSVGDSMDSNRGDTDYCSNPGGSQKPTLEISCLNEFAACCGYSSRNGACTKKQDDYMSATNSKLTDNSCSAASFSSGSSSSSNTGDDDTTGGTTKVGSNDSDNAAVASLGSAVLLTFGAITW